MRGEEREEASPLYLHTENNQILKVTKARKKCYLWT